MRELVIVGAGGFGREVLDVIDAINTVQPTWRVIGFLDDSPSEADERRIRTLGYQLLNGTSNCNGLEYVIGIGNGLIRERVAQRMTSADMIPAPALIHPGASIGAETSIDAGSVVCAGARITTNIRIGAHVHLNLNVTVGHDTTIEDYVTVNPIVAISGNCHIKARSNLGTHSAILPGVTVGTDSVVGAAACVVRDVPSGATVRGVPAK